MTLKLYEYFEDFGRMGSLTGIFVEDDETVAKADGALVYAYELLGKHSECEVSINDETLTPLDVDDAFIATFVKILPHGVGINPVDMWREEGEDYAAEVRAAYL